MMAGRKRTDEEEIVINEGLDLQDEDRLPWLEPVEDYDREPSVSPVNLMGLVLGGLLLLGVIVGGVYWLQNRSGSGSDLIAAQEGDYKIAPTESGAKTFDGTGDASFATSEGAEPNGKIDATKVAEQPAVSKVDAAAPAPGTPAAKIAEAKAKADAAAKATAAKTPAAAPVKTAAAPGVPVKPAAPVAASAAVAGTAMVQLGAFGSDATANSAWGGLTKRFPYLAGLTKTVVPAAVGGGTVYRLRANTGSAAQAADICSKLRKAGENCIVVR
jgi:cell division protein FtsN